MRFYRIIVSNDDGELVKYWDSTQGDGSTNPGALNITLDFPTFNFALPNGGCFLQIWGISLQDIAQASNLNGMIVQVYGGMQKGLPLANPRQAGLLLAGRIQQCFGNWQGTEQNLSMVILYGGDLGSPDAPVNLTLNWRAGTELSVAVNNALQVAFPDLRRRVACTRGLVKSSDDVSFYNSVQELSQFAKQASRAILGGTYLGVNVTVRDNGFLIYDGTVAIDGISENTPKQIQFVDLIGQPTWFAPLQVQFKCVMRSDITVGDWVKMPPAQFTTSPNSLSQFRDNSIFQGAFFVQTVRHIGNFRQHDANSWVTVIEAAYTKATT